MDNDLSNNAEDRLQGPAGRSEEAKGTVRNPVRRSGQGSGVHAKIPGTELIAYFRDEPGAEAMDNLLVTPGKKDSPLHMTDVNYAEVKYSIVKKDGAAAWVEAAKILQGLPIDFAADGNNIRADDARHYLEKRTVELPEAGWARGQGDRENRPLPRRKISRNNAT